MPENFCGVCSKPLQQSMQTLCQACRDIFCSIKGRAHGKVSAAIKNGHLQPPHQHNCVDCGRPADRYDHRYYAKPLDVDAVCHSCDFHRGPSRDYAQVVIAEMLQPTFKKTRTKHARHAREFKVSRQRVQQVLGKWAGS